MIFENECSISFVYPEIVKTRKIIKIQSKKANRERERNILNSRMKCFETRVWVNFFLDS